MVFDIQDMLIILVEMICCKIFFETFSIKRDVKSYCSVIVVIGLTIIFYPLTYLLGKHFIVKEIAVIMITALAMKSYLDIKLMKAIVISALYTSIIILVDYCGFSIISYFFSSYETMSEQYQIGGKLVVIFCKICLFFVILIINQRMKYKSEESLEDNEWVRFIIFPLFTIVIIAAMISAFKYVEEPEQANVLFIMAFGLVGINLVAFFLINDVLIRERNIRSEKLFILESRNRMNLYMSISEDFDKQRKKTHEYKNQIMCMEGLLTQGSYEKAIEYVQNISDVLSHELDAINANHTIVNAVLNTKYQEALEKDIVLVMRINDLSKIWIQDEDIVIILSNLLDNAIEAVEKCREKKIIQLKFVVENEIILSVKNSYADKPIMENGIPITSKKEKSIHGIGIKNVIDVVNKYHGSYIIRDEDEEYFFSIIIP